MSEGGRLAAAWSCGCFAVALGGCSLIVEPRVSNGDGLVDAGDAVDVRLLDSGDARDLACSDLQSSFFDPCDYVAVVPANTWRVEQDTAVSADALAQDPYNLEVYHLGGTESSPAIVAVGRFQVVEGATLRLIGPRPVIVASWETIAVAGAIDVGSYLDDEPGAGAGRAGCGFSAGSPGSDAYGGAGGGGGGAFGGAGAAGGSGSIGATPVAAGAGGEAAAVPSEVVGGCPGGAGGQGSTTSPAGGLGGGAILLTSRTSVGITGAVLAGGQGGGGGSKDSGGGGGGSGGLIALEAPSVTVGAGAVVAANGGGGGGGSTDANPGVAGQDGHASSTPALGGFGQDNDGSPSNGGAGAAGATLPEEGVDGSGGGGGGGGGGLGLVLAVGQTTIVSGATVSPAVTALAQ